MDRWCCRWPSARHTAFSRESTLARDLTFLANGLVSVRATSPPSLIMGNIAALRHAQVPPSARPSAFPSLVRPLTLVDSPHVFVGRSC
jgi:hypothetical protein